MSDTSTSQVQVLAPREVPLGGPRAMTVRRELVRNGAIGKIDRVECSFGPPGIPCDLPEEEMEPGLDWNMWVGPAPMRPYHSELSPRGVHDRFSGRSARRRATP